MAAGHERLKITCLKGITMISFYNDYSEGAHERVMEALMRTNRVQTPGYGEDEFCEEAKTQIRRHLRKTETAIHFLVGGTQTNTTVIASVLKPYQGVIAADTGHIAVHESGAVEATGHKVLTLPHTNGKINADQVERLIRAHYDSESFEHQVQPGMVYISQPTEYGTIYSKAELEALHRVCRKFHIPLFVDGARLGAALVCSECDFTLADLEELADMFYIGGTKMGALFGEAVVISNPDYQDCFRYMIKQKGGMLAKGRLLGIQFAELFRDDLYFELARHAVRLAQKMAAGIRELGYPFMLESPTNQIFPIFPDELIHQLEDKYSCSYWDWGRPDPQHSITRIVTSWATDEANVDAFLAELKFLSKG